MSFEMQMFDAFFFKLNVHYYLGQFLTVEEQGKDGNIMIWIWLSLLETKHLVGLSGTFKSPDS